LKLLINKSVMIKCLKRKPNTPPIVI